MGREGVRVYCGEEEGEGQGWERGAVKHSDKCVS